MPHGSAVVFLILLSALFPAQAGPREFDIVLTAAATIGADGAMQSLEWQDKAPAVKLIAGRVEPVVRGWTFKPGELDGVPASTQTYLKLRFKGVAGEDGSMQLRFVSAQTGARMAPVDVPHYPVAAVRAHANGMVVAIVRFDERGKASLASYEYEGKDGFRDAFVRATQDAVVRWKVDPELVGGRAVATSMRVPVIYCTSPGPCPKPRPTDGAGEGDTNPVALESAVKLLSAPDPLSGS